MYKVEYLPLAKNDLIDIIKYISNDLQSPLVANRLAEEIVVKIEKLSLFPYKNSMYLPVNELETEYRKLSIKKYIVFFYIDEETKVVTIARVIYNKRDISSILKKK